MTPGNYPYFDIYLSWGTRSSQYLFLKDYKLAYIIFCNRPLLKDSKIGLLFETQIERQWYGILVSRVILEQQMSCCERHKI